MPKPSSLRDVLRRPLNVTILAVLAIAATLYLYAAQQERHHDAAARAWLQRALLDIGRWETAALHRHLAAPARETVSQEQLRALVERYRPLGAFEGLDELQFTRLTAALSLFSGDTLLGYRAQARFAHGSAQLSAVLMAEDGDYRFYNFNLSNPQLEPGR